MSDGVRIMAQASTTPPRDPAELRARARDLLRARLEELWADLRSRPRLADPKQSTEPSEG